MAKSSKFPGMGRAGNTLGKVSTESRTPYTPKGRGGDLNSRKGSSWAPGKKAVGTTQGMSSHNDISAFDSTIRSRGNYNGPRFSSLNTLQANYQKSTPNSNARTPSGGGVKGARGASRA